MPRIGSRSLARIILSVVQEHLIMSDEWRQIGTGCFRYAFLHIPTNVVYKVGSNEWGESDGYGNEMEVKNAQRLWDLSSGDGYLTGYLRIPLTSGFRFETGTVCAMEYITPSENPEEDSTQGRIDLFNIGRFRDMHFENFVVEPGGVVVPIDMASPRTRTSKVNKKNYHSGSLPDGRVVAGLPLADELYAVRMR